MTLLKIIIFLQLVAVILATNVNVGNIESKILDQIFSPANYDKRIRPRPNNTASSPNAPLSIFVEMYIISLTLANEEKQSYNVDIYFREKWLDERLKYDAVNGRIDYLSLNSLENIWVPDLFFVNEMKGHLHTITSPNIFIRISPDGQVFLSQRLHLQLSTDFNYHKFPFDCQRIQLRIESYGYSTDDLLLKWKMYDTVSINRDLQIPLFTIEGIESFGDIVQVSTGTYSYLKAQITVARKFNYYLIHVFIPCTMMIIVAYLNFWIDIKFLTGRVILSVSTLYTLSILINSLNTSFPKVYYTKLIDWYTGMSSTFVFFALVEVVVAQAYENCSKRNSVDEQEENQQLKSFNVKRMRQWLKSTAVNKIDAIFRLAYPIGFILFLVSYTIAVFV